MILSDKSFGTKPGDLGKVLNPCLQKNIKQVNLNDRDIEDYLSKLQDGWLSEDGLDDQDSDDENRDADEVIRVLQEENDDDDDVDETADIDPPFVEPEDQEPSQSSHPSTSSSFAFDKRSLIWKKRNLVYDTDKITFLGSSTASAIMPVTTLKKKAGSRGRKPGKANVITSSPYLKELETSIVTSAEKKLKATRRLTTDNNKKNNEKRNINEAGPSGLTLTKRQLRKRLPSSSSDGSNDAFELQDSSDDDLSNEVPAKSPDDDAACIFCYRYFSEDTSGEIWIQ
ncbi:hypothetical protein RN001_003704 [Aquatica leii]|uniref:Uncharacterized protein n=1 Tax=Aquatica leii TaxID=1421715 RepID=A0AAN7QP90_9COLE|nr:hypothetical protein RN001_003704 [Aquatica leii]